MSDLRTAIKALPYPEGDPAGPPTWTDGWNDAIAAVLVAIPEGAVLVTPAPSGDADAAWFLVPTRLLRCDYPPNDGVLPGNPRFDDLFASIREVGIREPLTIRADWLVIDGAHRLSAARLLGIDMVPVRVWTGMEWVPEAALRAVAPSDGAGGLDIIGVVTDDVIRATQVAMQGAAEARMPSPVFVPYDDARSVAFAVMDAARAALTEPTP